MVSLVKCEILLSAIKDFRSLEIFLIGQGFFFFFLFWPRVAYGGIEPSSQLSRHAADAIVP